MSRIEPTVEAEALKAALERSPETAPAAEVSGVRGHAGMTPLTHRLGRLIFRAIALLLGVAALGAAGLFVAAGFDAPMFAIFALGFGVGAIGVWCGAALEPTGFSMNENFLNGFAINAGDAQLRAGGIRTPSNNIFPIGSSSLD